MRADSDMDVLLVTDQARSAAFRGCLLAAIAREVGLVTPLEVYIVTTKEYEEWYRKFIDVPGGISFPLSRAAVLARLDKA